MKTINLFQLGITLTILCLLLSCRKNADITPGSYLSTTPPSGNELDSWIEENFAKPYNIEVVYRWSQPLLGMDDYLYPPALDSVKPMLKLIKKLWIEPYSSVADPRLVSKVAPRQLVLVGGMKAIPGATILGTAQQGRRVILYEVNLMRKNSLSELAHLLHVVQHEYVHILNQTKPFDERTFGKITPDYSPEHVTSNDEAAQAEGFVTSYAQTNAWEDFAEMGAMMLTCSRSEWKDALKTVPETGQSKIKQKEQLVVEYYKTAYGIDLYQLQEKAYGEIIKSVK